MAAITADLENILAQQKREQDHRVASGEIPEQPEQEVGCHQKQAMVPPNPAIQMLNKEMAEAAAVKFKEKEQQIQKACRRIDSEEDKHFHNKEVCRTVDGTHDNENGSATKCTCTIL